MPLKAYVGLPRHGKSYEVVTEVIYPSLCRGRRVVSNIAGLNRDAMLERFEASGGDSSQFGELVHVSHEQVLKPDFWLTDKDAAQGVVSFLQPGDVLALDEIWRFWSGFGPADSEGVKRPDRVMNFFRMHGHFTHPVSGYCCEVALITQDLGDIHRSVRAVVEETYRMTKLTALGSSKRYRVDIFHRGRVVKAAQIRSMQRAYNPDLFCFYSSHSQRKEGDAEAIEESPDQRGNVLRGVLFRVVLPALALLSLGAGFLVWRFFHPEQKKPDAVKVEAGKPAGSASAPVSPAKPARVEESHEWRAAGYIAIDGSMVVVAMSPAGAVRYLEPPAFKLSRGGTIEAAMPDGQMAVSWARPATEKVFPGGKP